MGTHKIIFDSSNVNWMNDQSYNELFLRGHENFFNSMLRIRGYVFRNEIYNALDLPLTKEGQIEGWKLGESNENGEEHITFKCWPDPALQQIVIEFEDHGEIYELLPAEAS
jgi:hypothetical protein